MSIGFMTHPTFRPVFAVDAEVAKPSSRAGSLGCNLSYEANIGIRVRNTDLKVYSPFSLLEESGLRPGELDVLIACPPCTGFSRQLGKNHLEDYPRNCLVERIGCFVDVLRPSVLIMENARELITGRFSYHYSNLCEHLNKLGYSTSGEIHMLTEFGLPQIRQRAIVVAVREHGQTRTLRDLWEGYIVKPEALTVRRAIGHLPPIRAGETHPLDPLHVSPGFANENTYNRIHNIPHDGGSWADLVQHPDAESLLIPAMKRIVSRGKYGSFPDVYGRLSWDRPAVTIKRECAHVGNGRYSHPEQDRLCTVREMALLQGFPEGYRITAPGLANKYRHIGDAVPPLISYQLAHICHWILTGYKPDIRACVLKGTSLDRGDIMSKCVSENKSHPVINQINLGINQWVSRKGTSDFVSKK